MDRFCLIISKWQNETKSRQVSVNEEMDAFL